MTKFKRITNSTVEGQFKITTTVPLINVLSSQFLIKYGKSQTKTKLGFERVDWR